MPNQVIQQLAIYWPRIHTQSVENFAAAERHTRHQASIEAMVAVLVESRQLSDRTSENSKEKSLGPAVGSSY